MEALSKAKVKFFTSLGRKKNRYEAKLFMVEGLKMFQEAYQSKWEIEAVVCQEDKIDHFEKKLSYIPAYKCWYVSPTQFHQLSELQHPEGILTILKFPDFFIGKSLSTNELVINKDQPSLLLEDIQDPGNLGTLMRTSDWFGITDLYCSWNTVDVLNGKVIRATMGAIFRVNIHYILDWRDFIMRFKERIWIADLAGVSIEEANMRGADWILLGNEAKGVHKETLAIPGIRRFIIPGKGKSESLNVSITGGICMYHLNKLMN